MEIQKKIMKIENKFSCKIAHQYGNKVLKFAQSYKNTCFLPILEKFYAFSIFALIMNFNNFSPWRCNTRR